MADSGKQGIFITLEGVDGSGKSTKAEILRLDLQALGYEVVSLREPGGTALSEKIRYLLLNPANSEMCDECELLLYEASRAQLVREVIEPALERGAVVICDRFFDSTFAYQCVARGLDEEMVRTANRLGSCGIMPDRTIIFDVAPDAALGRAVKDGADRLEGEGVNFQERVREGYKRLAAEEPRRVRMVDGTGEIPEVYGRMVEQLSDLLPDLVDKNGSHE